MVPAGEFLHVLTEFRSVHAALAFSQLKCLKRDLRAVLTCFLNAGRQSNHAICDYLFSAALCSLYEVYLFATLLLLKYLLKSYLLEEADAVCYYLQHKCIGHVKA